MISVNLRRYTEHNFKFYFSLPRIHKIPVVAQNREVLCKTEVPNPVLRIFEGLTLQISIF